MKIFLAILISGTMGVVASIMAIKNIYVYCHGEDTLLLASFQSVIALCLFTNANALIKMN